MFVQIKLYVCIILNGIYTKDIRISLIGKALCYGHKDWKFESFIRLHTPHCKTQ